MPGPGFLRLPAADCFGKIVVCSNVSGGLRQLKANSVAASSASREPIAFNRKNVMWKAMLVVPGGVDSRCEYGFPWSEPVGHSRVT